MPSNHFKTENGKVLETSVEKIETPSNGNEHEDLQQLRRLIVHAEGVGRVLPAALEHVTREDYKKITQATLPLVEESLRISAKHNPQILAEVLFPVIGPAIRKAIAEALGTMVQSLNQTLEYSVSPKGLRWRMEAWQTGKPFAEVVILNTLLYRVEQVFLVHRETGIMLRHVAADASMMEDADMISAMLTAIQDFVHDSFKTSADATLDSLQVNDVSVWIERSPNAILAAVIRGNAPLSLRETFKNAIEKIQSEDEDELNEFKGETEVFETTEPILRECLQLQVGEKRERMLPSFKPLYIFGAILGAVALLIGIYYVFDYWRWTNYLNRLNNEAGIVVTESRRGWFKHSVRGLRDSEAVNPDDFLPEFGYDSSDVETKWQSHLDLSEDFVLARAKKILRPPEGVSLMLENGILTANGQFSGNWLSESAKIAPAIAGVNEFRFGTDLLKAGIESEKILFRCGTTDLEESEGRIGQIAEKLEQYLAANAAKNFVIEVQGNTTFDGTQEANSKIGQLRAEKIFAELSAKSDKIKQNSARFKIVKVLPDAGKTGDCCVTFKISE